MDFDPGMTLAQQFRAHAGDQTHLYACAMRSMADDWDAGGPIREVCAGYETAPSRLMIHLRLLAGIFRLVLTDRAPELRAFYPCLGGHAPPETAWPVMRRAVAEHVAELNRSLEVAPQTNEVGRSVALLAGLFDLVESAGLVRIRLLEVGASAGLNLLLDRFYVSGDGWEYGPPNSPVRFERAVRGPVRLQHFQLTSRRGCDLEPVDITTEQGRTLLTSFVWPFDLHRHQRLAAVLPMAQHNPPVVDAASAGDWLFRQLQGTGEPDELTVIWQSVTRLYWPEAEIAAVDRLLNDRGAERALGHVSMEYNPTGGQPELRTQLWLPGRALVRRRLLGTVHDHGIPVRLEVA